MKLFTALVPVALILGSCSYVKNIPYLPTSSPAVSIKSSEVENLSETERLNAFFQTLFDERVQRSPMMQTTLGIKTDYDKWDDPSPRTSRRELQILRRAVGQMNKEFDFAKLDEQAKLSWKLLEYRLDQQEAAYAYRDHSYPFNQMFGVQSGIPAFLVNQHRIASYSDADAYIARLGSVDKYLSAHIKNATRSENKGILPPKFVFDYVIQDANNVIKGEPFDGEGVSPLLSDFRSKLEALTSKGEISDEEAKALENTAIDRLLKVVGPAYRRLISFATTQQASATTDDGAWKLPDGKDYYSMRLKQMTTTEMSADDIHNLGLHEVDRIHAEMREVMKKVGYKGELSEFFEYTRSNKRFFKPNTDEGKAEYLAEAKEMIDQMSKRLPSQFRRFPKAKMIVKAVEPFREKSAGKAFYQRPSPDGSRPGVYYANLYDTAAMPIYQMEALAYHEGVPGHHMQIAIAQELEGIPKFRKYGRYTAYTEGWGLYSEYFPKEMGFYKDPYSDFGRLAMELWRAARLVVDTGIHSKKWTREQAIEYLMQNTPNPKSDCEKAIERYIVMPGQATAYKIGMITILELRKMSKFELGSKFDIRDFHDVVLKSGPVPLKILEENVRTWIEDTKSAS